MRTNYIKVTAISACSLYNARYAHIFSSIVYPSKRRSVSARIIFMYQMSIVDNDNRPHKTDDTTSSL